MSLILVCLEISFYFYFAIKWFKYGSHAIIKWVVKL